MLRRVTATSAAALRFPLNAFASVSACSAFAPQSSLHHSCPPCLLGRRHDQRRAASTHCLASKLTNTSQYHGVAEAFIEDVSDACDALLDAHECVQDVVMRDGVLEVRVAAQGTFVLNKQAPLHQLWLSSPLSGPHHYDFDTEARRWVSDKDGHDLQAKLERELSQVIGTAVGPLSSKK